MKILYVVIFCILSLNLYAQEHDLKVLSINSELLQNANAVKRFDRQKIFINSLKSVKSIHHYAITVFNQNGDDFAGLVVYYDKMNDVASIKGNLYDATGKKIQSLKAKDIQDFSAISDYSISEDGRIKVHNFKHNIYPYTVEYFIETNSNQTFLIPSWRPVTAENIAVEESNFSISYPQDYKLRYTTANYANDIVVKNEKGINSIFLECKNLKAVVIPFATLSWSDLSPAAYFAPSDFEISGYKGNMNTWEGFGKFQYSLNLNRDNLPVQVVQKVQDLTKNLNTDKEKVEVLYKFLQENTRYISVQLGIGGWQPFDAGYVAKNGFGDCKALSNYMHSLLKTAGIRSLYTIINAGPSGYDMKRMKNDFPSQQFNHVVLCVPQKNDTIWLECTSQTNPAGYMGSFTGNRQAVAIDENGGYVVSTPKYGINDNTLNRKAVCKIDQEGNLEISANTVYSCLQQDRISAMINSLSEADLRKNLERNLPLTNFKILNFSYKQNKSAHPEVFENLNIVAENYANVSGKRIFFKPNILNKLGLQIQRDSLRKNDFVIVTSERDIDEVEFTLPEGYEPESGNKSTSLVSEFGKYSSIIKFENGKVIFHRVFEKYEGSYPASVQDEIIKFYKDIFNAERASVVLVKK